jgi:flavin-dependent dehydrogenase
MDNTLLERAKQCGVKVIDGCSVTSVEKQNGSIRRISARQHNGTVRELAADLFVDATGRSQALTRLTRSQKERTKPAFVGFKAHLTGADVPQGVCEIYSFDGGYAGLSNVEGDRANLCFLVRSEVVRESGSNASELVDDVIRKNRRASANTRPMGNGRRLACSIDLEFWSDRSSPVRKPFHRRRRGRVYRPVHWQRDADGRTELGDAR